MKDKYRAIGRNGVLAQASAADLIAADTILVEKIKRARKSNDWRATGYAVEVFDTSRRRWDRIAGDEAEAAR